MPIKLISHQIRPSDELLEFLLGFGNNAHGVLLLGNTGVGKTYVIADAIARAQQEHKRFLCDPLEKFRNYSVMMLTPKRAITQQKRVFYRAGIKDFEITNHNALTSKSYGALFIDWLTEYKHGELDMQPYWIEESKPDLLVVDECQLVKNRNAARTKIIHAAIRQGIKVVLTSATPFATASEAETVVVSCGIVKSFENFSQYANSVSRNPDKPSPAAIKAIKQDLIERKGLIAIKGARYPFKPIVNNIKLPLSKEQRIIYDETWNEYVKVLAKEGRNGPSGIARVWVAQNKHREATDILKAPALAKRAFQVVNFVESPRQIIIASNFVKALEAIWNNLVKIHNVNPNSIATLFGGITDKQAQKNIDDFQQGKVDYFLTTMKSGGTSISLHHEFPEAKPRYVLLPPTWSIYEMVQILGRAQRITSLSQTIQEIVWFKDTIEEKVCDTVNDKWRSVRELLERKDNFLQNIFHSGVSEYVDSKELSNNNESNNDNENNKDDNKDDVEDVDLGMLGNEKEFGEEN